MRPGSPLGRRYEERRVENILYTLARFHTPREVPRLFEEAGFEALEARQTLFSDPETTTGPDPVREERGKEDFVVLRGEQPA